MNAIATGNAVTNNKVTRAKVLCIDDDPNVSHAMQLWLNQYEVELIVAQFGMQGLSLAAKERPAAIITDVRMPQGDGEHVVACLKQIPETRDIPIIVLTGQRDTSLQLRMTRLGIHRFLTKPVSWQALEQALFAVVPLPKIDQPHDQIQPHLH